MTDTRLNTLLQTKSLQPLLPVIYIAWADGELAEAEHDRIRDLAEVLPALDENARNALDAVTQSKQPLSATELARLRHHIRDRARERKSTLAAMAAAMADSAPAELTEALAAYERDQGISGVGVAAEIFREAGPGLRQVFDEPQPSFDPSDLQRSLEGKYADEWAWVRRVLKADIFNYDHDASTEQQRERVLGWLKYLSGENMGGYALPESVGGQGNMPGFIHLFQALAMFDLSLVVKFGVQFGLFGGSIMFLGTGAQHKRYLADVASLAKLGGFAMTESGHGSNVQALETTATYDAESEQFIINSPSMSSRKEWIGNVARDGHYVTVFARLQTGGEDYGVHAFVVPIRGDNGNPWPGVRIEDCGHKMGLNGVDNGRLYFDHVKFPRENLLDRYGQVAPDGAYDSPISSENKRFFTMLGTLVGGRISVAAASVTASKKTLAIAVRYGALRRQFGGNGCGEMPVLDYKTHQTRLFPLLAHSFALHFAVEDLIERFKNRTPETSREVETLAAGLKSKASWHAIDAAQAARECCGGLGFLSENQIAAIRRDIDVFATFEGDNTVLMNLLAKNRLSRYGKSFEQNLVMTLLGDLTERAKADLLEGNPIIARRTDDEHLRDVDFHREVLKLRAHNLLVSAARRIRKRIDNNIEPFDAFSQIQDHMMAYAHAEMEHHIAERFAEAVEAMDDGPAKDALEKMRQLSAVDTIYRDSAWYLDNGYFESSKRRALRKLRLKLLEEIRPNALAYVDAFAIPEGCLSAPIAFENYIGRAPRASVQQRL